MFERLLLCPFAVADLTTANANVFYELGIRHAVRSHSTLMIFNSSAQRLPFDVAPLRALPYEVAGNGTTLAPETLRRSIAERLEAARNPDASPATDSPLIELLDGYEPPDLSRLKTDAFRDRVHYSERAKTDLRRARRDGVDAVLAVEQSLGAPAELEAGVLVDLLLSYRDVSAWLDMLRVVEEMPREIAGTVLVQEQYGFALNRAERSGDAADVLSGVIDRLGASSETYGLLGRVHKDRWRRAAREGRAVQAAGYLDRAIEAYRSGFQHDWRDAYPGINLASLLHVRNHHDEELIAVLPVVAYAVRRRMAAHPDYWDHATAIELAFLQGDRDVALMAARAALSAEDAEPWKVDSTADNLTMHQEAGSTSSDGRALADELIEVLRPAESCGADDEVADG